MNKTFITIALMAGSIGAAQAAQPGAYVFGLGGMHLDKYQEKFTAKLGKVAASDSISSRAGYGELGAGYRVSDYLATEVSLYGDFGKQKDSPATLGKTFSNNSFGAKIGVLGMLPLGERFDVYGKAALGYGRITVFNENKFSETGSVDGAPVAVSGQKIEDRKKWKLTPSLGMGAIYRFNKNLAVRAEYEYSFNRKASAKASGEASVRSSKVIDLNGSLSRKNSQVIKVGLQYSF